mgnify:FL=1
MLYGHILVGWMELIAITGGTFELCFYSNALLEILK